jgi:hypothetical protein
MFVRSSYPGPNFNSCAVNSTATRLQSIVLARHYFWCQIWSNNGRAAAQHP